MNKFQTIRFVFLLISAASAMVCFFNSYSLLRPPDPSIFNLCDKTNATVCDSLYIAIGGIDITRSLGWLLFGGLIITAYLAVFSWFGVLMLEDEIKELKYKSMEVNHEKV